MLKPITDQNTFAIYLKARELAERTLILNYINTTDPSYQRRKEWAEEAQRELLAELWENDEVENA